VPAAGVPISIRAQNMDGEAMPSATRDGRELPYRVRGDGPVVGLVPDACVGPWSWSWVVDSLGDEVKTVVYRPAAPRRSDTILELARDLEAVLSAVEAARVHLVGCGLGGRIALRHAHEFGRSRSLLLLGTGEAELEPAVQDALLDADPIASLRPYLNDLLEVLDTATIEEWRSRDDPSPTERRHQLDLLAESTSLPLHEITLPTWIRHGEHDRVLPRATGQRLADELPNGSYEEVREAPHLLPVATPKLVADDVIGLAEAVTDQS
jgi:3-oxoadipate enol-lactonase